MATYWPIGPGPNPPLPGNRLPVYNAVSVPSTPSPTPPYPYTPPYVYLPITPLPGSITGGSFAI